MSGNLKWEKNSIKDSDPKKELLVPRDYIVNGNRILVVLQGYAMDHKRLGSYINYLNKYGLHNIIVSSYSKFTEYINASTITLDDPSRGVRYGDLVSTKMQETRKDRYDLYYPGYINMNVIRANVNFQIESTLAGIKKAYRENLDFDFVLKCRADYEMHFENNWLDKIVDKLDSIKYRKTGLYHKKIFGKVLGNWHVDDFIFFGIKEDMFNMFNIPFKNTNEPPEVYLLKAYPRSQEYSGSWKIFKKRYIEDLFPYDVTGNWTKAQMHDELNKLLNK